MLVYQTGRRELIYVQAHNDYLQLAAEGGALVVVPAVVVLAVLVRSIRRRLLSADDDSLSAWVRVGAVAGLVGIGAQSLMEFSLQMPGNALMFSVLVALAVHRPRRVSRAHRV
jgi:O-antigen ligase